MISKKLLEISIFLFWLLCPWTFLKAQAPDLTISKMVESSTNPLTEITAGNATFADAADTVTFLMVIENTSNFPAFNVRINDLPASGMRDCKLLSVKEGDGVTSVPCFGDLFTDGVTLIFPLAANDGQPGTGPDMVLVKYTCIPKIEVIPDQVLENTGSVRWKASPGGSTLTPKSDNATVTISPPGISKIITGISPNYTGQLDKVQVNDTISYRIRITIPEGTNPGVRLRDVLSSGMENISIDSMIVNPALSTSIPGGFAAIAARPISGSSFNLDFGDILNSQTDNTVDELIVLYYRVLIVNSPLNVQGRNLRNRARWQYNQNKFINSNRPQVVVWNPNVVLSNGIVSSSNPTANGTITPVTDPPDGNISQSEAGDQLTMVATVENIGLGNALNVVITNKPLTQFTNCSLLSVENQAGVPLGFSGDLFTTGLVLNDPLPGNSKAVITYNCTISSSVHSGEFFKDTTVVLWEPALGLTGPNVGMDDLSVKIKGFSNKINLLNVEPGSSLNPQEATIGDVLSYEVVISVPKGNTPGTVFEDTLDQCLAFIGVDTVLAAPAISTSVAGGFPMLNQNEVIANLGVGDVNLDRIMTLDFGNIANSDLNLATDENITIRYKARVLNCLDNVRGRMLKNAATWHWVDPDSGDPLQIAALDTVTIIEPTLQIENSFTNSNPQGNEQTTVILDLSHTPESNSAANDVFLSDVLPKGILFVPGTFAGNCPATPTFTPDATAATGGTVSANWSHFAIGSSCQIRFNVQRDTTVSFCQDFQNCADLSWESLDDNDQIGLPNPPANPLGLERAGSGGNAGLLNNYDAQACANLLITNGLLATPILAGPNTACEGDQAIIEVTSSYSGSTITYNWFGPSGALANTNAQLVLNPLATSDSGDYFCFVTVDGCTSDTSALFNLAVNPKPAAPVATAGSPFCESDTLFLFATNAPAGSTYEWNGPNAFSSTAQNPVLPNFQISANGTYQVVIISPQGCTSDTASVIVAANPNPTAAPTNNGASCFGDLNLFANPSGGTGVYSFSWSGPNGFSSSVENPVVVNPTLADSGTYVLVLTDGNACSSVDSTQVNIANDPLVPTVNSNSPLCEGETLTLSTLDLTGTVVTYEWSGPNGTSTTNGDFPNAPSFSIPNVSTVNAGDYKVLITVDGCATDSSAAHAVVVNTAPAVAPASDFAGNCVGRADNVTLSANPSGGIAPYSFAWTGPNGFSSNQENPVLLNANSSMSGTYNVLVTDANNCGSTTGSIFLNFNDGPSIPLIASPTNGVICEGQSLILSVPPFIGTNVTYEWTRDSVAVGTNSNFLTINSASPADAGEYRVTVTVDSCVVSSPGFTQTVHPKPVVVTDSLYSVPCTDGFADLILNAEPQSGTAPFSFSWNGANGFASLEEDPALVNVNASFSGVYTVQMTDGNGCTSDLASAIVDVTSSLLQPLIDFNGTACEGVDIPMSIPPFSGTNVTYNWTKDSVPVGGNSNVLLLENAALADTGAYQVQVMVDGCETTSNLFDLVINEAPQVLIEPMDSIFCTDGTQDLTFNATASGGSGGYAFQWTGPNNFNSQLEDPQIFNIGGDGTGAYSVVVTDAIGCSSPAASVSLEIRAAVVQPIISQTGTACEGGELVLNVQNYNGATLLYDWTTPNDTTTTISGLKTNQITINPVEKGLHEGDYVLAVNVDGCAAISDTFNLVVLDSPQVDPLSSDSTAICFGADLNLSANASGLAPLTYEWSGPDNFNSNAANPLLQNVSPLNNGDYLLTVGSANGCSTTSTVLVENILPSPPVPVLTISTPVCDGEDLMLTTSSTGQQFEWIGPLGDDPATLALPGLTTSSDTTLISPGSDAYLSGDWQLRLIDTNNCVSALSAPVNLEILPVPVAIPTHSGDVCQGGAVQLFANPIPGAAYEWRFAADSVIFSTQANPSIANLTDTTSFELTATINGCSSEAASITVNVLPPPVAVPEAATFLNPDCSPSALQLFANVTGSEPLTFAWTGPNNFSSGISDPVISNISPANNGIYELTVTDVSGCTATYATDLVTIVPNQFAEAVITAPSTACVGEDIELIVNPYSGDSVTYVWMKDGVALSAIDSNHLIINSISLADAGFYKVRVSVDSCVIESQEVFLPVLDQATIAPSFQLTAPACEGGTLELFANPGTGSGNSSFQWTGPGGFTSNLQNPVISNISIAGNGVYTLSIFNQNGCQTSASIEVDSILPQPQQPTAFAKSPVCENDEIVLILQQQYAGDTVAFSWFNGLNQFIGTGASLTISASDSAALSPFRAQVFVDGCLSELSPPATVEIQELPEASASNNGPVCQGGQVQLMGGVVEGAVYQWRIAGTNAIVSTDQNPVLFGLNERTTFELTLVVNGCESINSATTTVEVGQVPVIANLSGGGTFCNQAEVVLSASNAAPIVGSITYTWSGPNGFSFTNTVNSDSAFTVVIPNTGNVSGIYNLVLESQAGCLSTTQSVTVNLLGATENPVLNAANSVICEGETLTLNATSYNTTAVSYQWFFNNGFENILMAETNAPVFFINAATVANSGEYSVSATVNGCPTGLSNAQEVLVVGSATTPAATNSTSQNQPACEGELVQLSVDLIPGATYEWFGPNGFTSNLLNPVISAASPADAGDYFAVAMVNQCSNVVSSTTTVFVKPRPASPSISGGGLFCEGDKVTLGATNLPNLSPGDMLSFEWFFAPTNSSVATTDTSFLVIDPAQPSASGDYFVLMTLNGCTAEASAPISLGINALPSEEANAGTDQNVCAGSSIQLNATVSEGSTGFWTSPSGASIANPTAAATEATNLREGQNSFVWTLSQGACVDFDADTVLVNLGFLPADVANAGPDQNVCGSASVFLQASVPQESFGAWTQSVNQANQGVVILDPANPNTQVTGVSPGNDYSFSWTLSTAACGAFDSDEVVLSILELPPNVAFIAKEEVFLCDQEQVVLQAQQPSEGFGRWTTSGGALIVEPTQAVTIAADFDSGRNVLFWKLSNAACENYSSDSILIFNDALPLTRPDTFALESSSDTLQEASLVANDDLDGLHEWDLQIVEQPQNGFVIYLGNGEISYFPDTNAIGTDEFFYVVCNKNCPTECSGSKVTIQVNGSFGSRQDCFTPNLITPNNDGMNDALVFTCLGSEFPNSQVMIFNRWGDKIFDEKPYRNDWQGTYKNQLLPAGSYYYILKLNDELEPLTGFVTIVR